VDIRCVKVALKELLSFLRTAYALRIPTNMLTQHYCFIYVLLMFHNSLFKFSNYHGEES